MSGERMITLFRIDYLGEKYDPDSGLYYMDVDRFVYFWVYDSGMDEFNQWIDENTPEKRAVKVLEVLSRNHMEKIKNADYIN